MPFIFTLNPMPGSQIYNEYLEQGRILIDRPWDHYGGGHIVYTHPAMSEKEMLAANAEVMRKGYSLPRILKRTFHTMSRRFSMDVALSTFFTQLGLRKAYRRLYDKIP
jgi:hypothetical protein